MLNCKKGFTLIELLVSVSIIGIILTVVLWNFGGFNEKLALSSAAQEMALSIRQTQTYGINVRESAVSSNQFSNAYGIYISSLTPSSYVVYVDSNSNNTYNAGTDVLVETVSLRNGMTISGVCNNGTSGCTTPSGGVGANITFLRPNPDARIYFTNSSGVNIAGGPVALGKIQLRSPKGTFVYVIIESTGQITLQ